MIRMIELYHPACLGYHPDDQDDIPKVDKKIRESKENEGAVPGSAPGVVFPTSPNDFPIWGLSSYTHVQKLTSGKLVLKAYTFQF